MKNVSLKSGFSMYHKDCHTIKTVGQLKNITDIEGSHVAQLVGRWTHNPRVVGSLPGDADCFMWDNILGQDVNLDCASLHPGVMGTWLMGS